jgi:exopolysaccharide biosynthesis protein
VIAVIAALAVLSAGARAAPLPLGPAGLKERRAVHQVAGGVAWTHITRRGSGGPFRVDVLEIDPERKFGVLTAHDRVPGLERPSAMARRHDAIAGVNGGYFAADGDPTGVVAAAGELLSEPVGPRTAFIAPDRIAAVRWRGKVTAGGKTRILDGVNRTRGRIPACGGVGGDVPTQKVDPATICTDSSELVLLTAAYGGRVPSSGANVRIGGGSVLTGSGDAARFLRRIEPGDHPTLDLGIDGEVLGGAPRLLRDGRLHITARREGKAADTGRNPRTVAGVREDGTVLLITIDGRRPGWSLGATFKEAAKTARALGATDALTLDSGGSTAMVIGDKVVNRPSEGERAVSNGLFVLSS